MNTDSESMLCLGEDVVRYSHTFLVIRPVVEKFTLGVKYVKSLDGLLERLDTLAFHINNLSKSLGLSSVELFKLVLSCDEVKEVLKPFANYANEIQNKVITDPRHKTLKLYLSLLLELLKGLEPLRNVAEEGAKETAEGLQGLREKSPAKYQVLHPMILLAVQRFVSEARYLKSVEGFLERLDTLASQVTEASKSLGLNPEEVFRSILLNEEVKEALRPLALYADEVKLIVESSPRHKPLRPYLHTLIDVLTSLPPAERELEISRLPLFLIDRKRYEEPSTKVKPSTKAENTHQYLGKELAYESEPEYAHDYENRVWRSKESMGYANTVTKPRRRFSKKKTAIALTILIIAMLLAGYFLEIPWISSLSRRIASAILRPVASATARLFEHFYEPTLEEIKLAVLNKINEERQKRGLPPIQLLEVGVAQRRAGYIVSTKYWGHCTHLGDPPSYWYTIKNVSMYYVEENLGLYQKCVYNYPYGSVSPGVINFREALNYALDSVHRMIYDDAHANWGHRDSLLDPTNNYVDIGVAVGNGISVVVIHMLKVWVIWDEPPSYNSSTGLFKARGTLTLLGSQITSVIIYKHGEPDIACHGLICIPIIRIEPPSLRQACNLVTETNDDCLNKRPVVGVTPPKANMVYIGIESIDAIEWITEGQHFSIKFVWKPLEPGIYTVIFWARNTIGIEHPYDPDRYKDFVPVLGYTIKYTQ